MVTFQEVKGTYFEIILLENIKGCCASSYRSLRQLGSSYTEKARP